MSCAYCTSVPAGTVVVWLPKEPECVDDATNAVFPYGFPTVPDPAAVAKVNFYFNRKMAGWLVLVKGFPHGFLFRWDKEEDV